MTEEAASSSDADGYSTLIFYLVVVGPALNWILRPGRFPKHRAILYAVAFLVALAAIKTGGDFMSKPPNFYRILQVDRDASLQDIKRMYKRRSVELHPDRNPSPSAAEEFNTLRQAYDALSDADLRVKYEVFGNRALDSHFDLEAHAITSALGVVTYYITWLLFSYVLCIGSPPTALIWTYTGLGCLLLFEVNVLFNGYRVPVWLLPRVTSYEVVGVFKDVFPAFMNGCKVISSYTHLDRTEELKNITIGVLNTNRQLYLMMRDIQAALQSESRRGSKGQSATSPAPAGEVQTEVQTSASVSKRSKTQRHPQGKKEQGPSAPVAGAGSGSNPPIIDEGIASGAVPNIEQPPSFKVPRFVMAFAVFFFFRWLFG